MCIMVRKLTYISTFFNWVFQLCYVFNLRLKNCAIKVLEFKLLWSKLEKQMKSLTLWKPNYSVENSSLAVSWMWTIYEEIQKSSFSIILTSLYHILLFLLCPKTNASWQKLCLLFTLHYLAVPYWEQTG